jgi:hypothetical protein
MQRAPEEVGDERERALEKVAAYGERALEDFADDGERAPYGTEWNVDGSASPCHQSPEKRVPCRLRVIPPVPPGHACRYAGLLRDPEGEEPVDGAAAERHRAPKKTTDEAATLRLPRHLLSLPILGRSRSCAVLGGS